MQGVSKNNDPEDKRSVLDYRFLIILGINTFYEDIESKSNHRNTRRVTKTGLPSAECFGRSTPVPYFLLI